MQKEITVSINCITYNHENYIADAIEGFLMQKTDFPIEILIHDDASTDRTAEIIKGYEVKHPDLIKPIYQTENQYSKGRGVGRFNRERAKGKYLAICEGDDYWIDPYKLQKQVDYMEANPECSLCVHAAHRVKPDKKRLKSSVRPNKGNKIYSVDEVILGGCLFATNSMLYPAVLNNNRPDFIGNAPVGDYPTEIYLSLCGDVYYMDEFMSAYRVNVPGSWTSTIASDTEKSARHRLRLIDMLDEIDIYTEGKYKNTINRTKAELKFEHFFILEKLDELKKEEFKEIYSSLSLIEKNKLFLKQYLPRTTKILIDAKRKLSR